MKKIVIGMLFLAAMASTSLYAAGKKSVKKSDKCSKTEVGCCKKGEKKSACCMDKAEASEKKK